MKKLIIASICLLNIALALLGFKLYYIKQELESLHEPKSAVTDTVKVDTLSFEQKLAMADSVFASKKNVSYAIKDEKDEDVFWNNEGVFGNNVNRNQKGVYQVNDGTEFLSSITKYRNGLPELAIEWWYIEKRYVPVGLLYFSDEGKEIASSSKWVPSNKYRWNCKEHASEHTYTDGITRGYRFAVEDPRSCLHIKN